MIKRLNSESDFITLRQSEEFEVRYESESERENSRSRRSIYAISLQLLSPRLRSSLLNAALDKLPSSTLTRKKRMPSRTGRIGTFSDVEVDDDDDDSDDVAVIGYIQEYIFEKKFLAMSITLNMQRVVREHTTAFHNINLIIFRNG